MRLHTVLAAAAAATLLLTVPAHATTPTAAHRAAGEVVTTTLYGAIDALPVADEDRTRYVRTAFRHWIDADKDGCDTRKEVLIAEATEAPVVGAKCALSGGEWFSPYDDLVLQDAKLLDVDHLVPLAEAWVSVPRPGARRSERPTPTTWTSPAH